MNFVGLSFRSVLDSVELASSFPVEIIEGICFSAFPFETGEVDPFVFEKTSS